MINFEIHFQKIEKAEIELEEAEEDELDEDEIEEAVFAGFTLKSPLTGKTTTGLDQVRAQTETVYEPFIFLTATTCYIVWWKSENIALKFELSPQAIKVSMTTQAPNRDQIITLSPQIPLTHCSPNRDIRCYLTCSNMAKFRRKSCFGPFCWGLCDLKLWQNIE